MDRYFIPDDYRKNPAITLDVDANDSYWNPDRIRTAVSYQREVYKWANTLMAGESIRRVADVGCGFAYKLHWLHQRNQGAEFWGIDQPNAIRICREHYAFGHWLSVDLNEPTLPPETFDLVISSDVIEHLENPDSLLDYIRGIVAPGGHALLSTVERNRLRGRHCRSCPNEAHVREWSLDEFAAYISSRGFTILEHRLLSARSPSPSLQYARKAVARALRGRSLRYNQAILARTG